VTGGVYTVCLRIHRSVMICDYWPFQVILRSTCRAQSQLADTFKGSLQIAPLSLIVVSIVARSKPRPRGREDLTQSRLQRTSIRNPLAHFSFVSKR